MGYSITLLQIHLEFNSRRKGVEKFKEVKKSSCVGGGWRWPKEEIWLLHTHFIQMKNEGSSFPLYYISCLEFCRLAQLSRTGKRWKSYSSSSSSRSTVYLCMAIHSTASSKLLFYYSKSSYLLKTTDDEKELPSFDALLHLFHPFSPQLPSVPIGLFAPRRFQGAF